MTDVAVTPPPARSADLILRSSQTIAELCRELLAGHHLAVPLEVGRDLTEHVVLPRLVEIGVDDLAGIGLGGIAVEAELLGGPQPEQLVAPGQTLEVGLLTMDVLTLA